MSPGLITFSSESGTVKLEVKLHRKKTLRGSSGAVAVCEYRVYHHRPQIIAWAGIR